MSDNLIKRLLHLDMHPESAPRQAAARIEVLEARAEKAEAERDALREALVKADDLAGAIEADVWENTQTWFALTAYREARDALNREPDT